jgi:hypothetical protein
VIFQRLIFLAVAIAAVAAAAIVAVFAAAFAVYAVLKALFGAAGAAAIVCLVFAILAGVASAIAAAKAKRAFKSADVREAPPPNLSDTLNELIRKRPVATAGVALAAGLAAVLQPKLAATLVKAFMAKSGDRKAR